MPGQIEALARAEDRGGVCMVNLLKFKEWAVYEDGRETVLAGAEAYQLYGGPMGELITAAGGSIVFSSVVTGLVGRLNIATRQISSG